MVSSSLVPRLDVGRTVPPADRKLIYRLTTQSSTIRGRGQPHEIAYLRSAVCENCKCNNINMFYTIREWSWIRLTA